MYSGNVRNYSSGAHIEVRCVSTALVRIKYMGRGVGENKEVVWGGRGLTQYGTTSLYRLVAENGDNMETENLKDRIKGLEKYSDDIRDKQRRL